jgi:glycerol-3-phosphate acyltransferase PlsY
MEEISLIKVLMVLAAYLLGSIPTAVWVAKKFYHIDIRQHGSGNAGATNTFRVLGKKAGIPVLIFDIFKGWLPVFLFSRLSGYETASVAYVNFQLIIGAAALLGHIFPVFAGFKGGKGVATLLGVVIALHLEASLVSIAIFLVIFLATRYVSLGSMISAFTYPILLFLFFRPVPLSLIYFAMIIAIMVLFTHQKNIERLVKKEENRVKFKKIKHKM